MEYIEDWKSTGGIAGVCRCCLADGCYKEISTEYLWMGEREVYEDMLLECFELTISHLDGNTTSARHICEVCITRLRDAMNFKKQVISSENSMKNRYSSGNYKPSKKSETEVPLIKSEIPADSDDMMATADFLSDSDDEESLKPLIQITKREEKNPEEVPQKSSKRKATSKVKHKAKKVRDEPSTSKVKKKGKSDMTKPVSPAIRTTTRGTLKRNAPQTVPGLKVRDHTMKKGNARTLVENSNLRPFVWHATQYKCIVCQEAFFQPDDFRTHTDSHDIKKIVSNLFPPKAKFIKVDVGYLKCRLCNLAIADMESLKVHLRSAHAKHLYECNDLLVPYRLSEAGFKCELCTDTFQMFHLLNRHMNIHYKNHTCDTCGAGFMTHDRLRVHMTTHERGNFQCPQCPKVFGSALKTSQHVDRVHKKNKRFKCPMCESRFTEYHQRNRHMVETHNCEAQIHKCELCDKQFALKRTLRNHIRAIHFQEKNHECEVCGQKFFRKQCYEMHLEAHNGYRSYSCEVCSKSYSRKRSLRQHMKSHEEKSYPCDDCVVVPRSY